MILAISKKGSRGNGAHSHANAPEENSCNTPTACSRVTPQWFDYRPIWVETLVGTTPAKASIPCKNWLTRNLMADRNSAPPAQNASAQKGDTCPLPPQRYIGGPLSKLL